MKKILAVILSVCVILAYMPMMAFAASSSTQKSDSVVSVAVHNESTPTDITTTYYDENSKNSAISRLGHITASATDVSYGDTLTFLKSTTVEGLSIDKYVNIVINNGVTVTFKGTNSIENAHVVNNGTICIDEGSLDISSLAKLATNVVASGIYTPNGKFTMAAGENSTLTIDRALFDHSNLNNITPGASGCIFPSNGVTAKSTVVAGDTTYVYGEDSWPTVVAKWNNNNYPSVQAAVDAAKANAANSTSATISVIADTADDATINASTMTYTLSTTKTLSGTIAVTSGKLIINGGTYTAMPTATSPGVLSIVAGTFPSQPAASVLATGSIATRNSNGTYTVRQSTKTLANATVTFGASQYKSTVQPKPVVKDGTTTLVEGTHYTLSYTTTTAATASRAGTVKVTITGKAGSEYEGTRKEVTYTIVVNPTSITGATVTGLTDAVYTGSIIAKDPIVTVGGKTLVKGTDYTVAYNPTSPKNIGTVTVTITGKDAYTGTISKTYDITGAADVKYTVITAIGDQTYTGVAIRPSLYVTYGKTVLKENIDYVVSYSSNISVGTATATITGKGSYTGTNSATFKIKYNLANATVTPSATSFKYDGTAKAPTVVVKYGTSTLTAGTDYVVSSMVANKTVGTYTVTISAPTTSTRTMGSTSFTYKITGDPQTMTGVVAKASKTMASSDWVIKPSAPDATSYSFKSSDENVVKVASNGLVEIMGIGKATITVTTLGNVSHEAATETMTVTVKPKKVSVKSLTSTKTGKMTVKYYKQPGGITGTQIRYSKSEDFDTYSKYTSKVTNDTDVMKVGTKTLKVKSGKTYYVKVRNYKKLDDGTILYGAWSKVKKVAVK